MKRVAVAVVLLALLGVAACGDERVPAPPPATSPPESEAPVLRKTPAPPRPDVPSWAKVAPEQIAEAKKHGVPVAFENDLGMRFVLIPAGTFLMGSPEDEEGRNDLYDDKSDENQRRVTLTKPYYMLITELTNAQYRHYERDHNSGDWQRHDRIPDDLNSDDQPVVNVSWTDATSYAKWLSAQDDNRAYELPTEAQWEYACRAGTTTSSWFGKPISTKQALFRRDHAWRVTLLGSARVGRFPPNGWGLYDMHGNVWEWCFDLYAEDRDSIQVTDPRGPSSGGSRVLRGGSWASRPEELRSANRLARKCGSAMSGFRLISPLPESSK